MKQKYESPELDVYIFDVRDAIMNTGCPPYNAGGGCDLYCVTDGTCIVDTGMDCIMDTSSL